MIPNEIDNSESLGRGVFESRQAQRTRPRAKIYVSAFSAGPMSVDRLDHADIVRLCAVHDCEAVKRPSVRNFYGWYAFDAGLVRSIEMDLEFTPTKSNPWHSEISPSQAAKDDNDLLLTQCNELASESEWVPRP